MQQQQSNLNTIDDGFRHVHKDINKNDRTIVHYISSGDSNRYGQILPIAGFNENEYRKNPIVLFQHGTTDSIMNTPAKDQLDFLIGKNLWTKQSGNYLQVKTQFNKRDFADDVFNMNVSGDLNSWSKYWFPITEPKAENGFLTVEQWGIYEYSSVFVPVDTNAVNNLEVNKNMLSMAKSDLMKNFLTKNAVDEALHIDIEATIKPLQDEINELKKNVFDSEIFKKEINQMIFESIKAYNKNMSEKLPEIVGAKIFETLNKMGISDLDSVINNKVAGAIRKVTGIL